MNKGNYVAVRSYTSKPDKGLIYPAFSGILLDDAGTSEGWDVVDILDNALGETISVYCFSIKR